MDTETIPNISISKRNNDLNKLAYDIANSEDSWRCDSSDHRNHSDDSKSHTEKNGQSYNGKSRWP
jgi:hypothetical protein